MSVNKYNSTTGQLELIAGGTLYADTPIGSVVYTYETTAPDGFLFPIGQTLSRIEYSDLFTFAVSRGLLETTAGDGKPFGLGDGSTTFTLPDLREVAFVGAGQNAKLSITTHDVYNVGQFKDDQIQNITGDTVTGAYSNAPGSSKTYLNPSGAFQNLGSSNDVSLNGGDVQTIAIYQGTLDASRVARTGTTTHGKQYGLNAMMKVKQIGVPADFISEVENVTADLQNDVDRLEIEVDQLPKGVVPKGTVAFENLPNLADVDIGWMYNISNDFVTDSNFAVSGIAEKAGSNVYCINTGTEQVPVLKWDVFAAAQMVLPTVSSAVVGAMWLVE